MTLARARAFLQSRPGFSDTATVYKLSKKTRTVSFLRLFGFEIHGSGPGLTIRRPVAPESDGPGRGRPQGVIDMPRRPRRVMPSATTLLWEADNPYRGGTKAHDRFSLYRGATTVGESRALGASPLDIQKGIDTGHAQLGELEQMA